YCHVSFFFQAEDGIRDRNVTGVQTCALPISHRPVRPFGRGGGGGRGLPPPPEAVETKRLPHPPFADEGAVYFFCFPPTGGPAQRVGRGQSKVFWFLFFRKVTYWGCLPI